MIFATYTTAQEGPRPGLVKNGRVHALPFPDMHAVIEAGAEAGAGQASATPIHIAQVAFHSPIRPTTVRDGYAFEQHVKTANANRGREVPKEWYEFPVFYFANAGNVFGPNDEIPYPHYTDALDYELEIAVVIGKRGRDLNPKDAIDHIFGYTIFNDWSARDVQRKEMAVGLGPAKGKDFASSFGPYLVTPDEFADRATEKPGVYDLTMLARLNGETRSQGNFKDMYWSFGDLLARASDGVDLLPGDVIGSGTVGTGCLLELTKFQGPWLQPGDVVELEIDGIGVLRNQVAERSPA
ncbi:MAG TPA: fumarylacetoacetate hydrolase family protein [Anaerolineales bacterium]|jgi:fumarylacetoacetate (FAA) hydrolase